MSSVCKSCPCGAMTDNETCSPSQLAADPQASEANAVRKEILLLAVSSVIFFATLIFAQSIENHLGIWALRGFYAVPYLLCGTAIFQEAFAMARRGDVLNEFTLMGGATVAAIAIGELPEAVGVMLFYRIGEFFQDRAAAGSRGSIKSLLASKPTTARVVENGEVSLKAVEDVGVGQVVQVRPGEKIPLDGVVVGGSSSVDQSPLTGESMPLAVSEGYKALGGSINLDGLILVRVESLFADTHMARILNLVEHAAAAKSPTERFITRFARYYTPAVVLTALGAAVLPPLLIPGATFETWIYRALVMLVISCPCALLISIPLGYFGGIGAASRKGILVKGGGVLDSLLHIDTVVFDKTGTLTKGVFEVARLEPAPGTDEQKLLRAAVTAEAHSNHPIARSIMRYAEERGIALGADSGASEATETPGKGVSVVQSGAHYLVGTIVWLREHGVAAPEDTGNEAGIHVAEDGAYLGRIVVEDSVKPDAAEAVAALKARGIQSYMLTGDKSETAARVAKQTGLAGFRADLLPEGKVEAMREFADSSRAAFVGDGINDAPILALSRVGIAMGGVGAEAAIEAADAVILNDSPSKVADLLRIAADVRTIVWQNIVLALGVKTSFMVLGVAGLSGLWEAVFADVGVALLAVLNASRIMRK